MKKQVAIAIVCALVLSTVSFAEGKHGAEVKGLRTEHKNTQKAENVSFRGSLKGKSAEERAALKAEHRTTQQNENKEFKAQMETKKADWKSQKAQRQAKKASKTTVPAESAPSSGTGN